QLVTGTDGNVVHLRGVNFNNFHWESEAATIFNAPHHSETDYQRIADMGMNTVRFNLSHVIFEDGASADGTRANEAAWEWIDRNVSWAKTYGIYLILDMHVPPGGYQGGTAEGTELWTDPENRERFKTLWKTIAERYKDETTVAAYSLLNEPTPNENQAQWESLAQDLVTEIRTVDSNHLLIVEIMYPVDERPPPTHFLVNDGNVMYEFHSYYPGLFTQQFDITIGRGNWGKYPDEDIGAIDTTSGTEYADSIENPAVPPGDSSWRYYTGNLYRVTGDDIVIGIPTLASGVNEGEIYFDDFSVEEYDANGNFVRTIISADIDFYPWDGTLPIANYPAEPQWWRPWSKDGSGWHDVTETAHRGGYALVMGSVEASYTLSNSQLAFAVKKDYHYKISGWMRGEGVTDDSGYFTIEFYTLPVGQARMPFNRAFLESKLREHLHFGETNNVPMNVGEFGLTFYCFRNDNGGLSFVGDLMDLMMEEGLNFQFYDYHSSVYGIYRGEDSLPDPALANTSLIELFTSKLSGN
ncbi:MAG: glycoside hydrolase family 5 protein, partial [bacterium]|nr:glycoside hydrolase family 5 protein [bacterium]